MRAAEILEQYKIAAWFPSISHTKVSLVMSTSDPNSRSEPVQAEHLDEPASIPSSKMNTVSRQSRELNLSHTPDQLPEAIQSPKYAIGDRCRWLPANTADWGTIIGQVITPVEPVQFTTPQWVWLYLVLLDLDSPSRQWVTTDWAEEDDLERFHPPA